MINSLYGLIESEVYNSLENIPKQILYFLLLKTQSTTRKSRVEYRHRLLDITRHVTFPIEYNNKNTENPLKKSRFMNMITSSLCEQ